MSEKAKGTMENPYSWSEYSSMLDKGTWKGGFVKDDAGGVSYAMGDASCVGYSGSGSGSGGSDFEFSTGSYEWHYPDTETGSEDDGKQPGTGNEGGTGGGTGGNMGGGGGGTQGSSYTNSVLNAGEGSEKDVCYYTLEEIDKLMGEKMWHGGYVKGYGYIPADADTLVPLPIADSGEQIYQRALKYNGVPYKYGGLGMDGIDCSGLISVALGLKRRWTTGSGDIPDMVRMEFTDIENLRKGDVLVWRWQDAKGKWNGHAAIYVSGNSIFHAHGRAGSPTNQTDNLDSYWLKKKYIPVDPIVYRK